MSRPSLRDTIQRRMGASDRRVDHLQREPLTAGTISELVELVTRYVSFHTTISPWAPGSFIPLDWSAHTIARTNDVDGTEDAWNSADGAYSFSGESFSFDSATPAAFHVTGPGLFVVQMNAEFPNATGAFDVGFATEAGRSNLADHYPILMAHYSSDVATAGGANLATVGVTKVQYLTGSATVSLSVYHNGAGTWNLQNVVSISCAKLKLT